MTIHTYNLSTRLRELKATLWKKVSPSIKNYKQKTKWTKQVILLEFNCVSLPQN